MAALSDIRKLQFSNPTSGKVYSVAFKRNTDNTIDFVGALVGSKAGGFGSGAADQVNSDPEYDNTEIAGVVITSHEADVFGASVRSDAYLAQAAIYDASSRVALGAALSTLLV